MKKKQFPIGLTETQYEHIKSMSKGESMATYVRALIDKDIKDLVSLGKTLMMGEH